MKLKIDFDNKLITIEEDVNLNKLIHHLKKLFPDGEWRNYELQANKEIHYIPYQPYNIGTVTDGSGEWISPNLFKMS